ncbi:diguanylate cyclase [Ruminococcaceae bacterium OttesenSCG-928-O06]|nr:diguanylate cyclase [Ruminococcaceae bacterium OttesenSCG-928-O06]
MAPVDRSALLKENPTLTFRCLVQGGGALQLVVEDVNGPCEALFRLEEGKSLVGMDARELFCDDAQLVDEWMEFLVKMRHNPKEDMYDARDASLVSRRALQFIHLLKGWANVALDYDLNTAVAVAQFSPAKAANMKIGVRHLMGIKQTVWLGAYANTGGHWEVDIASNTVYVSRYMARALRLAEDAVIVPREAFLGKVHREDRPAVEAALANVESNLQPVTCRAMVDEGQVAVFTSFAIPGYGKDGKLERIVGQSQNITGTYLARQALARSEERFRSIVENSQDLFVVLRPDETVAYISPNVTSVLGYTVEKALGQSYRKVLAYKDEELQLAADFAAALNEGAQTSGEYLLRQAGGNLRWLLIRMSGIASAEDGPAEVVAVCRDVTEERKQEENLRYMSTHDSLTGVFNRFHYEEEMARIQAHEVVNVAVIMADLNGLKLVNDAFGHAKGDELLKEAAALLNRVCQHRHDVYRLGGDEFTILAYDMTEGDTDELGCRIDEECQKTKKRPIPINLSWGAALRRTTQQNMQDIYIQAESSMYANKLLDSRSMRSHVLATLKETLRSRNLETADHTQRMENMVMAVGRRLGLPTGDFDRLVLLASMHDIGKVAVPDDVINKPGKLTKAEWEIMRSHSETGSRIATTAQELSVISDEIACHHERWDGAGYPYGKQGEDIPLLSRIINVVDSYDVMTHKRVYKQTAMTHTEAIEELKRCSGSQFDPTIVDLFLEIFGGMNEEEMRRFAEGGPEDAGNTPGQ